MKKPKILVVEDESIIAMELEQRLQALGYQVAAIVSSGEDAIIEAEKSRPELVLMDIMLNGDMDGIKAASEIEARFNIPVIYLSANTDESTIARAKITNPYGYLVKPFEEKIFKITIEMALYKHEMERKLKENESWLNTTLKSIGEAVIAADNQGKVTLMNSVAETLTGWGEEEARGASLKSVFNVVTEESGREDELPALNGGGFPSMGEHSTLIARDGIHIPIDYSSAPIKDDNGHTLGEILIFQNISERVRAEEQIHHLATHDALTDLPNRHLFDDRLGHAISKAKRNQGMVAVLYLDMDGFKEVNDEYGHPTGDILLRLVGIRMSGQLRESDTVARVGGDEFAIILENLSSRENAASAAEKVLAALADPIRFEEYRKPITASIGISIFPMDGEDNEELLIKADVAMYKAKRAGKNKYQFSSAD